MSESRSLNRPCAAVLATLMFLPGVLHAELSSTVTLTSNYLFNGITLTDHDPALQPSLDWNNGSGLYAGLWASNVKFAPGTSVEFDATVGHWWQLNADWLLDAGIAQYTYHGSDGPQSRGFNFPEGYLIGMLRIISVPAVVIISSRSIMPSRLGRANCCCRSTARPPLKLTNLCATMMVPIITGGLVTSKRPLASTGFWPLTILIWSCRCSAMPGCRSVSVKPFRGKSGGHIRGPVCKLILYVLS